MPEDTSYVDFAEGRNNSRKRGFFRKRWDKLQEKREEWAEDMAERRKERREFQRKLSEAEKFGYRKERGEQRAQLATEGERYHEQQRAQKGRFTYGLERTKSWFGATFGNTAKVIIVVAVIILIFGIFTSDAKSAVWVRTQTQLDRFDPLINTIRTKYSPTAAFNKYVLGISAFEPPDKAPETKPSTIHLRDIRSLARTIYEKDKIIMIGTAEIDPFNIDAAKVAFNCNLEGSDKETTMYLTGKKGQENPNTIDIKKNVAKTVSFTCEIPPIDAVEGKDFDTKTVNVDWSFTDFITVTDIDVIAISQQAIEEAEASNQDPIKEFRNSDILDSKSFARDICVRNCYLSELALDINSEMPLADDTEYLLAINLVNLFERSTRGKVKNLKSIQLITPQDQSITADCPDFGPDKIFESSDQEFSQVNAAIANQFKDEGAKKNAIELFCKIKVVSTEEFPTIKKLRAIAVYDYGDIIKTPIVVEKRSKALGRIETTGAAT